MTAFSIVMPAYRAEQTIGRAVESLVAQTHADWELLVVADDGVDYQSHLTELNLCDRRIRFRSTGKVGAGPSFARNIGIESSRNAFIGNLDSDDTVDPDYLAALVEPIQRWGAATSHWVRVEGSRTVDTIKPPGTSALQFPSLLQHELAFANIVFDARRVRARWPNAFRYGEDQLFWVGLFDELESIGHVATTRYRYHTTTGSLSACADGTQYISSERERIVRWIDSSECTIRNDRNRRFFRRWLLTQNEIEPRLRHRRVSHASHQAEMTRALGTGWRRANFSRRALAVSKEVSDLARRADRMG